MAIKSKTATATFSRDEWVDPKTGKPHSGWIFRKHKTGDDDDAIQNAMVETNAAIDPEERRLARKQGKRYQPKVDIQVKATMAKATMAQMAVDWFGPEFTVPEEYEAEPGKLHSLAGSVPPCTLEWINEHDSDLLSEVEEFLDDLYSGRTPDQQADFPGEPAAVAESEAEPSGAAAAGDDTAA